MEKLYKIKFIKKFDKKMLGDTANCSKKNAESYIKNGYAEYVEEPKKEKNIKKKTKKKVIKKKETPEQKPEKEIEDMVEERKKEARWLSDLETLKKHYNKFKRDSEGFLIHDTKEQAEKYMRVTIKNSDRYVDMENEELRKEKKIQLVKEKVNAWAYNWKKERIKVISEIKEFADKQFTYSDLKDAVELKVKQQDEKIKEVKKEDKVREAEKRIEESKEKGLKEEILTMLLLKKREEATELIVKEIESKNYIYTTKDDIKSEMWIYKEGVYRPEGKSEIKEKVRKILEENFTAQLYNEILNKIEADTYIEHDEFFRTNYIDEVPVENGILNIFTRKINPFDPKRIFFNKLPIKYDEDAICPNILKFFEEVLKSKEDIPVMLEIFGFCLLKEYRFEKAFMFVGNGRNGKSKTLELLKRMVGIENCCSVPLSMITADSTSVIELFGKMVNLAGDLSNDSLKKTGMFKQTVGRDVIAAKRKYLRDLTFVNYSKHVFAANELPKVYDLSDGFWTKWLLLEFPYKFITKKEFDSLSKEEKVNKKIIDPNIIEKISTPQEMAGLLKLSLNSLKNLLEKEDFSYSKGTSEIKELWIRQSDSFTSFCMDKLDGDYSEKVSKKELRKEYNFYCRRHKLRGCSDKAIKATLEDRYGAIETQDWEGNRERYWEGIKIIINAK